MEREEEAALKRAYADTILNTTKEAAARVLSSEKKTRMYQQEIVTVKDEAITTLLRLKQMYDSKVKETEEMSLKQQQKVEELEAQLGEAEDIVGELRMELRALHDELNKVTNGNTSYLKGDHQEVSCRKASDAAVSSSQERSGAVPVEQSGSVVANGITNQSLARINSIKRCSSKDSMDRCHHTLPSILTKRREVEGCTQMIHAVDKKSMVNGDGKDPMVSQNTSPKEHEQNRRTVISATEARKEEKGILASPLCEETPVLAASKNRCIKYTFKRKRKKEASSNLEGDSSFEESRNVKQKTGEKDDGYLESLKPSFTGESSRDSLCVAQMARQLVPFSKKTSFAAELVNQ